MADAAAAVPERLLPHRIGGQALRRVHHVLRGDANPDHDGVDLERRNPEFQRHAHRSSAQVNARIDERRQGRRRERRLNGRLN